MRWGIACLRSARRKPSRQRAIGAIGPVVPANGMTILGSSHGVSAFTDLERGQRDARATILMRRFEPRAATVRRADCTSPSWTSQTFGTCQRGIADEHAHV